MFSRFFHNRLFHNRLLINVLLIIPILLVVFFEVYFYVTYPTGGFFSWVLFRNIFILLFIIFLIVLFNWQLSLRVKIMTQGAQQEKDIRELNERLSYDMQTLGIHNEKMGLLIELSQMMQACSNIKEVSKAIEIKCGRILHFAEGNLYIMNAIRKELDLAVSWGQPHAHVNMLLPDQCWALRKGAIYQVKNINTDLLCEHAEKDVSPYMCIPLVAQNEIFGLLHLDFSGENSFVNEENRILISAVTEALALGLANIKLRENLRDQSLHDSLTGLYNRRYLYEFLLHEINRAQRDKTNFAILLIDIDYFKNFNDNYGHEAGDLVLQELSQLFHNEVRASDISARYGGEEFICVLHDCGLDAARKRAEDLRVKISQLNIIFKNQHIENVNVSIGFSVYPDNGATTAELINAADKALYQAKEKGRNTVIAYDDIKKNT